MKSIILLFIAVILFSFTINAQEDKEKKGERHVYTVQTFKFKFSDLKQYLKLAEEHQAVINENEFILSQKVFTHLWGPDWTVMIVQEHADFASIEKAQKRNAELAKEKYKDKEELAKKAKIIGDMIYGHTDAIVKEVPSLTK